MMLCIVVILLSAARKWLAVLSGRLPALDLSEA